MRTLVCLLALVTTALGWTTAASAQSITSAQVPVKRTDPVYDVAEFAYYISAADCAENERFAFSFTGTFPNDVTLQVWVSEGADCTDPDERDSDGGCTRIKTITNPDPLDAVELFAEEIADAHESIDGCTDSESVTTPHQTEIWFMLMSGSQQDVPAGQYVQWTDTQVDLLGPSAPSIKSTSAADEAATINLEDIDSDDQYRAFCDPIVVSAGDGGGNASGGGTGSPQSKPQGGLTGGGGSGGSSGGAGDGGASVGGASDGGGGSSGGGTDGGGGAGTGGSGGGGTNPNCGTGALVAGEFPPIENACTGELNGPGVSVTGLANDTVYAIGIAAVDELGNPGQLSEIVCISPIPVDDFFDNYRAAGGQGGCIGGCAVANDGVPTSALVVGLALGFLLLRRRRARRAAKLMGPLAGALVLVSAAPALADGGIPDTNWRQHDRPTPEPPDTQFAFEVRFAPYWPQVDSEPGLTGTPYESTFGDDPRFYFGLEADWMPLRIPYVGTLGVAVGWGYTWASAHAKIEGCDPANPNAEIVVTADDEELAPCESEDVTSLEIMPMHASLVLRADELMRRTGVPLVPYGKFGFGWAFWSSDKTSGVSHVDVGEEDDLYAEDVTIGLHAALGLALALNWLDTRSAGSLRESTGIGHVYLFAEWMNAMLDGFGGGQMHVGSSTFVTGLTFDF